MRSLTWSSRVRLALIAMVAAVAFVGVAQAAAPPDPNTVGFTTLSNIQLNGVPGTVLVVAPGANVTISAAWADSHPDYCPGCIDFVAVGWAGQNAAGCIENPGFTGQSGTGSVNLGPAPTTPGTYDIVGHFEFVFYCGQYWVPSDSVNYTVVAKVVVVDANIKIGPPLATNPVGTNHVFTTTVNALGGTIDAGPHTATASIVSGPGSFVGSPTCTYTGGAATASCTVTITSAVAGATVVSATSNIPVSGVTITRTTGTAANTAAGGSGNATKWWFTPFALYGAGFGPSPFPSVSVSAYSKPLGTTMGLFQITDTGGTRYVRVQCLVRAGDRIWAGGTVYNDTHQPSLTGHTVLLMVRDAGATGDTWTYITDLSPAAAGQTLAACPLIDSTGLPQYPGNFFTIGL